MKKKIQLFPIKIDKGLRRPPRVLEIQSGIAAYPKQQKFINKSSSSSSLIFWTEIVVVAEVNKPKSISNRISAIKNDARRKVTSHLLFVLLCVPRVLKIISLRRLTCRTKYTEVTSKTKTKTLSTAIC